MHTIYKATDNVYWIPDEPPICYGVRNKARKGTSNKTNECTLFTYVHDKIGFAKIYAHSYPLKYICNQNIVTRAHNV